MYQNSSALGGGAKFSGIVGTYDADGYSQTLHYLKNESVAIMQELKAGRWIESWARGGLFEVKIGPFVFLLSQWSAKNWKILCCSPCIPLIIITRHSKSLSHAYSIKFSFFFVFTGRFLGASSMMTEGPGSSFSMFSPYFFFSAVFYYFFSSFFLTLSSTTI